ncbi:hypothetical protein [Entomomonas asaccharolytica]|uniref:Uncharacterized protein n=1 Tax=Entomomonas asaccharolytica TaxID=2785331 RepID=A0A974NE32_9GAMM|nr:hypothetical protein [Entomomonas asaccharolytica]QQP84789.1 hypothetical protein JHT90_10290 [Entomomonas asaccharolytica]
MITIEKENCSYTDLLTPDFFRYLADELEKVEKSSHKYKIDKIMKDCFQENMTTVELAYKLPRINSRKINSCLEEIGWVVNLRGYWIVTQKALENGYLYNKKKERMPLLTKKGAKFIVNLYLGDLLPLKLS